MRTITKLSLFALAAAGCGTTNNISTDPTANGVFPAQGFAGSTVRVEVTGDSTDWSSSTTVSFGAGVTVSSISVASPTDLFADIVIDGTATGQNDVVVTDGSDTFTLTKAFEIDSPIALSFQGDVAQGGIPFFTIRNIDITHPFDASTDANGLFINETLNPPAGVDLEISSVSDFTISGRAFIDANAVPGDVTLDSGVGSDLVTLDLGSVDVVARTPIALTAGTDTMGMIGDPGSTILYSVTTTQAALLDLASLDSTDPNAQPAFGLLTDGTWAHAAGLPLLVTTPGTLDLVVGDNGQGSKYTFTVNVSALNVTVGAETDDTKNNTLAGTTDVVADTAIPAALTPYALSSATDIDFIKLTNVPKGKTIHVTTTAGDPLTDTQVDIEDAAGVSLNGGDIDGGETDGADGGFTCEFEGVCGEDVSTTDPTAAAGTFFVKVSAGAAFSDTDGSYIVIITLE